MMGGGYLAGHQMRNSKIQGYPATVILGIGGLLGWRRAGRGGLRTVMAGFVGAGCYGMGKLGEEAGAKAGNDGNLFSWDSKGGVNLK